MRNESSRLRPESDCGSLGLDSLAYSCIQGRPGPRHVYAPSSLIIWRSLKPELLKLFRPKQDWQTFLWGGGACLNFAHFWTNSFSCGFLSSPATYFRLFQGHLSAHCRMVPWAAVRLARPFCPTCLLRARSDFPALLRYGQSSLVFLSHRTMSYTFCFAEWIFTYSGLKKEA